MAETLTDDKLDRIVSLTRMFEAHLQEVHIGQVEYPLLTIDDDAYIVSCNGCGWACSVEGNDDA